MRYAQELGDVQQLKTKLGNMTPNNRLGLW